MNHEPAYLWDPGAPVDLFVAELERRLAPLGGDAARFDQDVVRLVPDVPEARSRGNAAAVAASVVLVATTVWMLGRGPDLPVAVGLTPPGTGVGGMILVGMTLDSTARQTLRPQLAALGACHAPADTTVHAQVVPGPTTSVEVGGVNASANTCVTDAVRSWVLPGLPSFEIHVEFSQDQGATP